jgi:hypothetical protein
MKKTLLTISLLLASMLAVNAYAQTAAPGQDRAASCRLREQGRKGRREGRAQG